MKYLKYVWVFIPAFIYIGIAFKYSENIPIMDDYDAILQYIIDFNHLHSFFNKFVFLFHQHNEHRLLSSRLFYVSYYCITGDINFKNLIFIANLQLVVVGFISVYFIKQTGFKYWQIISFFWMLCLFDLSTYESASMAMCGMSNHGIIMLFFLSLFLYHRNKLILAGVIQSIMIFSNGNGMLGSLFIILYVCFSGDKKKILISSIITILFTSLYFIGYMNVSRDGSLPFNIETIMIFFIKNIGAYLNFTLSLFLGVMIIILSIIAFPYKGYKKFIPFICITGFLISSMLTTAVFRSCFSWAQFQASRYLIYPQLLFAVILVFSTSMKKLYFMSFLIFIITISYFNNFYYGKLGFERTSIHVNNVSYWYPDVKKSELILKESCEERIYCTE